MQGKPRVVKVPLVMDWISLIAVMNNCAQPNATVSRGGDQPLCGLCHFTTVHKAGFWKLNAHEKFNRYTADSAIWGLRQHLFGATPETCVWEPLHCHTRCLDNVIHFFHRSAPSKGRFEELMGRFHPGWKETTSLTIKTVSFLDLCQLEITCN